jgi:hypothetical protein
MPVCHGFSPERGMRAPETFESLRCAKTFLKFEAGEGAGAHCEVPASRLAHARIFDRLDETLGLGPE